MHVPAPGDQVFHVYADAALRAAPKRGPEKRPNGKPISRGRFGPSAVGAVIFNMENKVIEERGKYIGEHTNNRAELHALHHAAMIALEFLPNPVRSHVILHTDSELAYRGIKFNELHDPKLVAVRDSLRALHSAFRSVDYRKEPRDCAGIRRAEHLARKELEKRLGVRLRRRGRKAGKRHRKVASRNPYTDKLV